MLASASGVVQLIGLMKSTLISDWLQCGLERSEGFGPLGGMILTGKFPFKILNYSGS